jgi:hypothetical protein
MEETLRFVATSAMALRTAIVDTEILGHQIPKGTTVFLQCRVWATPTPVSDDKRSPSSRAALKKRPMGGLEGRSGRDLNKFDPRRWLALEVHDGVARDVFHANALPTLVFGGGPRGCFGMFDGSP